MDTYQKLFEAELVKTFVKGAKSEREIIHLLPELFRGTLNETVEVLHKELNKRAPAMLRAHRALQRGFVRRNIRRWQPGFDLLERLIVISEETGSTMNDLLRPQAAKDNDAMFEAVISNHARAVQVSREILALMIAGFPDGALGRWRTLHEIAVVTTFISHAGSEIAERYILHDHVTSYRRAKNYMDHHKRANLAPISQNVMDQLKAAHDAVINARGDKMDADYGWAAPAIKGRATFAALELATGLDHWRPRYKWATTNTHGSYRLPRGTLATSESDEPVLSVGESNSGMTDPGHMTAISLNLATLPVIMLEPNLDRLSVALIMQRLSDEIGDTFCRVDQESYERARGKTKR